jgi:hypothetical protein
MSLNPHLSICYKRRNYRGIAFIKNSGFTSSPWKEEHF